MWRVVGIAFLLMLACSVQRAAAGDGQHAPCVHAGAACAALNLDVTPETIAATVCVPGYTRTVRPTHSYVVGMKLIMVSAGGPDASAAMVLDHIVPLALGGHPTDPSNLQLQDPRESRRKDRIEVKLQCLVCTGQVPLEEARAAIAEDWEAAYHRFARVKCHRNRATAASILH